MDKHTERKLLTVSSAVVMILAAAAAGAQDATPSDLGPVYVTAQKRVQPLSEIPMSISVLGGDELEREHVDNFQDLTALVPGLSINTNTRGVSRITLRGVNTGGVASTVGVYTNDVPFGSSSGLANGAILSGDFDTFDLDRIEVLRGPQGTLYGASSLGGVIKYVSNEPSTDGFEARLQASVEQVDDGGEGLSIAGVVNIPIGDRAAIRVSGFSREDDGYIDSIGNNPIVSLQNPAVNIVDGTRVEKDINVTDTVGGRVSALFHVSDDFSINLTALMQNIDSDSSDAFEADPVTFNPLYGGLVASRYHPEFTEIEYRVYSATLDWDIGAFSLQSVTSYGTFEQDFQRDYAIRLSLSQLLTFLFSDPVTAQPPLSAVLQQITSTDKLTQEVRLVSDENDKLEWLVGLYYTEEDSGIDPQSIIAVDAGTENPAAGFPVLALASLTSDYEEMALFANATWHVSPRFDLSFGGRVSENDQNASQVIDGILVGGLTQFDDVSSSETPFTYSISPRFEVTDTASLYFRAATGYRPGGPNVLPPGAPPGTPATYDSDELTSYEIGVKAGSPDGKFMLEAAVFRLDWEDIQLFAVVNDVGINANGGTAVSKGVEFSATVRPTDRLTLSFTGAYTEAYLTEETDPIVGGLDGDPLSYVPDLAFSVGGDYEWPVFGDATAYIGGRVSHTGDRPADFGNRTVTGDIRNAESYTTTDVRAGVDFGKVNIEIFGRNLSDERGINDILPEGAYPNGAVGIAVIRPRTIGLSLGVRF